MARHAKVLDDRQLATFEEFISTNSSQALRDQVVVDLSFRAGLRVAEIANLRWEDVTDADGEITGETIFIPSQIVKFGKRERKVPMHPKLRASLIKLYALRRGQTYIVNKGYDDGQDTPMTANALTVYLHRLYAKAGFENASSHSGRRTLVTKLVRRANVHHCSIRDVQMIVGHAHISTTEHYVEPSDDVASMMAKEL